MQLTLFSKLCQNQNESIRITTNQGFAISCLIVFHLMFYISQQAFTARYQNGSDYQINEILLLLKMFVDHEIYNIPSKIGPIKIKPLYWSDFKGTPPQNSPYLAHIYWGVNYEFGNVSQGQPSVKVTVQVRPKSWRLVQDITLLTHQYGHYLIGCLCALAFAKKVNFELNKDPKLCFGDWCRQVLNQCLRHYCEMEREYDEETNHYMDEEKQQLWQNKIKQCFLEFNSFFQEKTKEEGRIVDRNNNKLSERNPNKMMSIKQQPKANANRNTHKNFSIKRQLQLKQQKRGDQTVSLKGKDLFQKDSSNDINQRKQTMFAQIRYYKKLQETDIQIDSKAKLTATKGTFPGRPYTTHLKPL